MKNYVSKPPVTCLLRYWQDLCTRTYDDRQSSTDCQSSSR